MVSASSGGLDTAMLAPARVSDRCKRDAGQHVRVFIVDRDRRVGIAASSAYQNSCRDMSDSEARRGQRHVAQGD